MQIDSHQSFRRYDAVGDSWITGEMRALQRDFPPERLAPELGANRACAIDGWERNLRVFCKLSGLITKADWNAWNAELCEPYPGIWFDEYGSMNMVPMHLGRTARCLARIGRCACRPGRMIG